MTIVQDCLYFFVAFVFLLQGSTALHITQYETRLTKSGDQEMHSRRRGQVVAKESVSHERVRDIGCYVYLPTGCKKRKKFDAPVWTRDPNGDKFHAHESPVACESRRKQYNSWCGVNDAQMNYVNRTEKEEEKTEQAPSHKKSDVPSKEVNQKSKEETRLEQSPSRKKSDIHALASMEWMSERKLYQKYGKTASKTLLEAGFIATRENPNNASQTEYAKQWIGEEVVKRMLKGSTIRKLLKHGVLSTRKNPNAHGRKQYSMAR